MFNSFLGTVKDSVDSANAVVNAKVSEGLQAALQSEKVKSATSLLQSVAAKVATPSAPAASTSAAPSSEETTANEATSPSSAESSSTESAVPVIDLSHSASPTNTAHTTHTAHAEETAQTVPLVDLTLANTDDNEQRQPENVSESLPLSVYASESAPIGTNTTQGGAPPTTSAEKSASSATTVVSSLTSSFTSSVECGGCGVALTVLSVALLDALQPNKPHRHCRVCARRFCLRCVSVSTLPVPFELLHTTYQQQYCLPSTGGDNKNNNITNNIVPQTTTLALKERETVAAATGRESEANDGGCVSAVSDANTNNTSTNTNNSIAVSATSTVSSVSGWLSKLSSSSAIAATAIATSSRTQPHTQTHTEQGEERAPSTDSNNDNDSTPTAQHTTHTYKADRQYVCTRVCAPRLRAFHMENLRAETVDKFAANFTAFLAATADLEEHLTTHKTRPGNEQNRDNPTSEDVNDNDTASELRLTCFFPLPSETVPDSAFRRALRLVLIADALADYTGLAFYIRAAKYAYLGSELVNVLIGSELHPVLGPLLQKLTRYGMAASPSAVLALYYLGCAHTERHRDRRHRIVTTTAHSTPSSQTHNSVLMIEDADTEQTSDTKPPVVSNITEKGVLLSVCPRSVLEYVSACVSPAQWLYSSSLPAPHNGPDWSAWYLSHLVQHEGYTLALSVGDSSKLPDGRKCPAFAVVLRVRVRDRERENTHTQTSETETESDSHIDAEVLKEAVVVVRGSSSSLDWAINFHEALSPYTYAYVSEEDASLSDNTRSHSHSETEVDISTEDASTDTESFLHTHTHAHTHSEQHTDRDTHTQHAERILGVHTVTGLVHAGILDGARGILDGYGLRVLVTLLHNAGFHIRCVGHSLGAGVATLIAAEMRVGVITQTVASLAHSLREKKTKNPTQQSTQSESVHHTEPTDDTADLRIADENTLESVELRENLLSSVHRTSAVAFSCPAMLSLPLAESLTRDRLLINVIHDADVIPRVSHRSLTHLAKELRDAQGVAQRCAEDDQQDLTMYMKRLGRAPDIRPKKKARDPGVTTAEEGAVVRETQGESAKIETKIARSIEDNNDSDSGSDSGDSDEAKSSTLTQAQTQPQSQSVTQSLWSALSSTFASSSSSLESKESKVVEMEMMSKTTSAQPLLTGTESVAETEAEKEPVFEHTVSPGPIIHLVPDHLGSMQARVLSHTHETWEHIELLLERLLDDHSMVTYRSAVQSVLFHVRRRDNTSHAHSHNSDDALDASWLSLFPKHTETFCRTQSHVKYHTVPVEMERDREEEMLTSTILSTHTHSATLAITDAPTPTKRVGSHTDITLTEFAPCAICSLDVTWPYITHSAGSRAMVKHYCAACRRVVCVFCSPAGDKLPGEGINQKVTLPDYRIALPDRGLFTPQRVCLHCYFNSLSSTPDHAHS